MVKYNTMFKLISANNKHSLPWYIMLVVITFCYVYQFDLSAFGISGQLHSSRIASVAVVVLAATNGLLTKRKIMVGCPAPKFKQYVRVHIFIFLYMVFLAIILGPWKGQHMMGTLINVFLFQFIPIVAYYQIVDKLDEVMRILLWVTIIQAIIIWICTLNPQISAAVDLMFNGDLFGETDFAVMRDGYAGGIGCITSSGVIKFSLGLIACSYLYFITQSGLYLILLMVLGLTNSMIARTGILVSIIVFIVVLIYILKQKSFSLLWKMIPVVILGLIVFFFATKKYTGFFEERFYRAISLRDQQKNASSITDIGYFQDYFYSETTKIPDISIETIIGTGVSSGKSGNGIEVNVDGGFIRLYVAYGLFGAIAFYLYFFYTIYMIIKKSKPFHVKVTLYLFLFLIIIGEFKEFAIYGTCIVVFFFLTALLSSKEYQY